MFGTCHSWVCVSVCSVPKIQQCFADHWSKHLCTVPHRSSLALESKYRFKYKTYSNKTWFHRSLVTTFLPMLVLVITSLALSFSTNSEMVSIIFVIVIMVFIFANIIYQHRLHQIVFNMIAKHRQAILYQVLITTTMEIISLLIIINIIIIMHHSHHHHQAILGQVLITSAMAIISLLVQTPSVPSMVHLWLASCQVIMMMNIHDDDDDLDDHNKCAIYDPLMAGIMSDWNDDNLTHICRMWWFYNGCDNPEQFSFLRFELCIKCW